MPDFDPDVYLSEKTASMNGSGFDPNAYLAEKSPAYDPEGINKEKYGPGLQDVTVPDLMAVQGVAGLAKAGTGMAARGVGAGLEALPLTKNIPQTVGDTANDMLLKSLGTSVGQVRNVGGIDAARDAAAVARKAGMSDVFTTDIGRKAALQNTIQKEGQNIGALRQQAGTASPDILENVKQNLMGKYGGKGLYANEAPQVEKSLATVAEQGPLTHANIAKGATELNKYASGEALKQPVNAITDVANKLSAANNAEIAQKLGADKAQEYLQALHNESGAFHLKPMLERGFNREAVSRGGGKNIIQSMIQKVADNGGYRAASKGFNALHQGLTGPLDLSGLPPAAAKSLLAYLSENQKGQ